MSESIVIRKAAESEIDDLIEIWIEKEKSLESKGIVVWNMEQFTKEKLRQKYRKPEYYIALIDDDIIGAFILLEKDIYFWPERQNDKAYYFHKFVITDKYAGRGFSDKILEWVKEYGMISGKDFIRLDFNENREYLQKMYYRNGFERICIMREDENDKIVLAEYRIDKELKEIS